MPDTRVIHENVAEIWKFCVLKCVVYNISSVCICAHVEAMADKRMGIPKRIPFPRYSFLLQGIFGKMLSHM